MHYRKHTLIDDEANIFYGRPDFFLSTLISKCHDFRCIFSCVFLGERGPIYLFIYFFLLNPVRSSSNLKSENNAKD